jgi:mono/diheme cytochrome c family protein
MKPLFRIVAGLAVLFLLAGCSGGTPPAAGSDAVGAGRQVYGENCAICHQADGGGVPNQQPALQGDAIVTGDPSRLIQVMLKGPAAVLPADRPHYPGLMPPYARLSDEEIADVLTYIRHDFGNGVPAIQPQDVATERGK